MRSTVTLFSLLLSACALEEGRGKITIDETDDTAEPIVDTALETLRDRVEELEEELEEAMAEEPCQLLPEPLILHPGGGVVLFSGLCASHVDLVSLTQSETIWDSQPMTRMGDDFWVGEGGGTTGWYRLIVQTRGGVVCLPGPSCDAGYYSTHNPL